MRSSESGRFSSPLGTPVKANKRLKARLFGAHSLTPNSCLPNCLSLLRSFSGWSSRILFHRGRSWQVNFHSCSFWSFLWSYSQLTSPSAYAWFPLVGKQSLSPSLHLLKTLLWMASSSSHAQTRRWRIWKSTFTWGDWKIWVEQMFSLCWFCWARGSWRCFRVQWEGTWCWIVHLCRWHHPFRWSSCAPNRKNINKSD